MLIEVVCAVGMALGTMRFRSIVMGYSCRRDSPYHVLRMSHKFHVTWIATVANSAQVIYLKTLRNRASQFTPEETMYGSACLFR